MSADLGVHHHKISYGDLFYLSFCRAGLNGRPSDLLCSLTPIVDERKARFNSIEKKITKRVGQGRSFALPYF